MRQSGLLAVRGTIIAGLSSELVDTIGVDEDAEEIADRAGVIGRGLPPRGHTCPPLAVGHGDTSSTLWRAVEGTMHTPRVHP